MRHQHAVQLRWSDPDVYGHVNHARALSLLEDARLTMASEAGDGGAAPPVILARLEVDYRRQLFYRPGEQVRVESWVTRLGRSSITTRQDLHQDGAVAISVVAVLVVVDGDASRPLTDAERAWWTTFLEEPAG
ncbi:acyl-CoA thioester hydrolase [Klenkia soli]|uniref:Acyl-CoA thioester hydrolase n=1 Tax=Klenkia soli TaxID=1052260 RepID=A0A1H0SZY9_9ACTN|nr:thioesterase family protein [Klenkia soli]SDP47363.1 acyl-CoA thioester hydrolase [Klenkia soli]